MKSSRFPKLKDQKKFRGYSGSGPRIILAFYLGVILLLTSAASQSALFIPEAQASRMLYHLEAPSAVGHTTLLESQTPILTSLYGETGQEHLLIAANPAEWERLTQEGLKLTPIEAYWDESTYYLASTPGAPEPRPLGPHAEPLYEENNQAVIRADPHQAQKLIGLGYDLKRLDLHYPTVFAESAPLWPAAITPDPVIQEVVDQVSIASVTSYDGGLSGEYPVIVGGGPYTITTRYTPAELPIEKATQYAYERLESFGLPVSYHYYDLYGSGDRRNVIAEQIGLADPTKIIMITAHLDSYSENPTNHAPGADDNASGSSAVLTAAQILSQYQFDYTLRYALFTGEEQGLIGSQAYATEARSHGDDIIAVLNLDMIGYNSDSALIIDLHTRPGHEEDLAIANLFSQVIPAYGINLVPKISSSGIQGSDHAAFWEVGYPAILGIEDLDDFTPYYHTTGDLTGTLDASYFHSNVKAAIATTAHLAGIRQPPGVLTGLVYEASTGHPIQGATVNAAHPEAAPFSTTTDEQGHYRMNLEAGSYMVTAYAPDYLPLTYTDIEITDNHTTKLNFTLERCNAVENLDFIYSPSAPMAGDGMTFTATVALSSTAPIHFQWDFDDGSYGRGAIVEHTFTISDVYDVTLTGTNCAGPAFYTQAVEVTGFPEIEITPTVISTTLEPGEAYTHSLKVHNRGADTLAWALSEQPDRLWLNAAPQEGLLPPLESQDVALGFSAPSQKGFFTTTLQINSDDLLHPQITLPISMTTAYLPPEAVQISYSPLKPRTGERVIFTGTVTTGSQPISYAWDFGDGNLANGPQVSHIYAASGAYTLTLEASNLVGSAETAQMIAVQKAPVAQVEPSYLYVNMLSGQMATEWLQITNQGGSPLLWQLGEWPEVSWLEVLTDTGSLAPQESLDIPVVLQAPQTTGSFTTTLRLNSDDPTTPWIPITVTLTSKCAPISGLEIITYPTHPNVGQEVTFTATLASGTPPLNYIWNFGDDSPPLSGSDLSTVSHVFPNSSTPESYITELSLSNACSQPILGQVAVLINPRASYLPLVWKGPPLEGSIMYRPTGH